MLALRRLAQLHRRQRLAARRRSGVAASAADDAMLQHCTNPATATVPFVQQQHPLAARWSSKWPDVRSEIIQEGAAAADRVLVKRSKTPEFMYAEPGVAGRLEDSGLGSGVQLVEMTPEQLFATTEAQRRHGGTGSNGGGSSQAASDRHTHHHHYYYYTAPLPLFDDRVDALCAGWESLIVDLDAATHQLATPPYASIWIGGEGSTTQAHYDVSNNILVQLGGRKRVRLWAPSAHHALQVFPDAHPRARKAQVRIKSTNSSSGGGGGGGGGNVNRGRSGHGADGGEQGCGGSLGSGAAGDDSLPDPVLDVVLQEGDAIYIPSFWFHHCEAIGASVSVNVFSDSHAKLHAQMMLGKLPQSLPSARHDLCPWFRTVRAPTPTPTPTPTPPFLFFFSFLLFFSSSSFLLFFCQLASGGGLLRHCSATGRLRPEMASC